MPDSESNNHPESFHQAANIFEVWSQSGITPSR
jgi:hypothetical protein